MRRFALTLLVLSLLGAPALDAQRGIRGGVVTRAPGRSAPVPGVGVRPISIPSDHRMGEPLKPGPIPLPSAKRTWVRVETPHFTILSSAGARPTRVIAHDLERLTALLTRTSPYFRLPSARARVFLFGDPRDVQPYFDAARGVRLDAAGVTVRHSEGSTILIDVTARGGQALTPKHELVHDLLRNNERPLPHWLEEGLAEYYSSAGQPIAEHVSRLRGRFRIPLTELFAMPYASPKAASWDFYAESWAAVAALLRRNPGAFHDFIADLDSGVSIAGALKAHYNFTLPEMESAMRKAGAPMVVLRGPVMELALDAVPLSYPELLFELGELLTRLPNRWADAENHFRAALPHLQQATTDRLDVAFALFLLYVRDGERDKADALFARLVESPRAYVSRKFLLDVDVDRADALAREGRLLEAAQILRNLAPKMPEKARLNLEAQAAGLEAAARP